MPVARTSKNVDKADNRSWFFGQMKRADAEKMLNQRAQVGEYLVRNSETSVRKICFFVYRFKIFSVMFHF